MIGGIKKVKAKQGKELEFEKVFSELKNHIRKNEPGNVYYDLYRDTEPGSYIVMERYLNQEALDTHKNSPEAGAYFLTLRALLDKLEVTYFQSID